MFDIFFSVDKPFNGSKTLNFELFLLTTFNRRLPGIMRKTKTTYVKLNLSADANRCFLLSQCQEVVLRAMAQVY